MRSVSEPVVDDVDPVLPTALEPGSTNAIGRMLGLLGDEWTLLILQRALRGTTRYGQFLDEVAISNAVLSARLATMEREGLLRRVVYQDRPVRAEYVLTQRGRGLWPVMIAIWDWERRWVPRHAATLPAMRHRLCGQDFAPVLTCRAAARPCAPATSMPSGGRAAPGSGPSRSRRPDGAPTPEPTGPLRDSSPRRWPSSATGGPPPSSAPPYGG